MDRFNERASNSELYARVSALPLTAGERENALSALRKGTRIANRILWVMNRIESLPTSALLKPATRWHRNLES